MKSTSVTRPKKISPATPEDVLKDVLARLPKTRGLIGKHVKVTDGKAQQTVIAVLYALCDGLEIAVIR
jgi:hypothetical protein